MNSDHLGSSKGTAENLAEAKGCVYEVPMRQGRYLAQFVLPRNFTKTEADRLCALIRALASS